MKFIVAILLLIASVAFGTEQASRERERHLGTIGAPYATESGARSMDEDLMRLDDCTQLEAGCPAADDLLYRLFGETRQCKFANYIVNLDQQIDSAGGSVTFRRHPPVLLWNGKNTRYLFGVQEVYILVFTKSKACFTAQVTTVAKNEPNPFEGVLKILGKGLTVSDGAPLKSQAAHFSWFPLSGDFGNPVMWLAIAPVPVDINTIDGLRCGSSSRNGHRTRHRARQTSVSRKVRFRDTNPTFWPTTPSSVTIATADSVSPLRLA